MRRRLLCTDLDRTLIPNGEQPESPRAQTLFARLAAREELTLVYVTGRHLRLIQEAIRQYDLPPPRFAIGDVGTTIYDVSSTEWALWPEWHNYLAQSWPLKRVDQLKCRLQSLPELTLQEAEKQSRFKVSYYIELDADQDRVRSVAREQTARCGLDANLIWSIDITGRVGLLDILPAKANKLKAVEFLMARHGFQPDDTLFAGDSGNDLDVFRSNIPSIVVANAEPEIKQWALTTHNQRLYVARGGLLELNGNYRAGILEGACYFWPEVEHWLADA